MQEVGLMGVLLEIQAYAIRENCIGLMPLIDTVFDAASEEIPQNMWGTSNAADVLSRISSTLTQGVNSPATRFTDPPAIPSRLLKITPAQNLASKSLPLS